ncbi:MAG: AraC family transcriptional regulator [Polyangiaceae bacterium]
MELTQLAAQVQALLADSSRDLPQHARPMPDVLLLHSTEPTPMKAALYDPVVCLILRGSKEVLLGDMDVRPGPGDALVVSHVLPVVSRITCARPDEPYLALILWLDVALLRTLHDEVESTGRRPKGAPESLAVCPADPRLIDAMSRYIALAGDEVEAKVLAHSIRREIHFRLLMAPNGGMLRSLMHHDSHASLIARAIARIRTDFRETIAMPALAKEIGMSLSSLHKHFREITSTTPLQYQKELRLLEARQLLLAGQRSVSDVAYQVGYESPNQFSREYTRKYGASPSVDLRRRAAAAQ